MMRKKIYLLLFFIASIAITYFSWSTTTYFGRYIKWRASDVEDYKKFPNYEFQPSDNPFYFSKELKNELDTLKVTRHTNEKTELATLLEESNTTAFLVIKNDTLRYEKYLNGYDENSINTSFSVAKSITSLLAGVAIDEKLIENINDPIVKYLPELLNTDPDYNKVTISYLLDMQSGIQFKDHDLPWGDKPKAYYSPHLREKVISLPLEFEPGTKFKYNSYNPIFVGMILEKVTHSPPAKYFEYKIWDELEMQYSGSWSMDSEKSGMTKMESGLNIRAIDFAKLGRLVLNGGNWNGKQIISKEWMKYSFEISEEFKVAEYAEDLYYRNFWWIYANKEKGGYNIKCIAGTGHLGQYLFIFPKEKIVIVRMGKDNDRVDSWRKLFEEIVVAIEKTAHSDT